MPGPEHRHIDVDLDCATQALARNRRCGAHPGRFKPFGGRSGLILAAMGFVPSISTRGSKHWIVPVNQGSGRNTDVRMADGTLTKSAGVTSEGWLTDSWYFACASKSLAPGQQFRRVILGQPVMLARTEKGEAFALRDVCPHRLVPLSAGKQIDTNGEPTIRSAPIMAGASARMADAGTCRRW